ncbi:MAG: radical SAM protein [Candidatus Thorarchaeota archaeon]
MDCPHHEKRLASSILGYCGECASYRPDLLSVAAAIHAHLRERSGLIPRIPNEGKDVCADCGNHCRLDEGMIGFCHNRIGTKAGVKSRYGKAVPVTWYFDVLPTNCVADWVCSISCSPNRTHDGKRLKNLAVFYGSCNSDCLFCQNASYKDLMKAGRPLMRPENLASVADDATACVCYFGGDPSCNSEHSVRTSKILYDKWNMRVCYETNGNISAKWLQKIADIVQQSRGTLKFDLKALTPSLYQTLTGVRNNLAVSNFKKLARIGENRENEFLVASILLVPGYIGAKELELLCSFIALCDQTIPTAFLGFYPHHSMIDLPRTSRGHALKAMEIAKESGLTNVRIGNQWLLSGSEYNFE